MRKGHLRRLINKILLLIFAFGACIVLLGACTATRKTKKTKSCNCPVWSVSNQFIENETGGI